MNNNLHNRPMSLKPNYPTTICSAVLSRRLVSHPAHCLVAVLTLLLLTFATFGQNARNTDYSPDKSLKSNARVNPSTLAMEMSVPIAGYPGRGGNSLPISFDYSSKVWEIETIGSWMSQYGVRTDTRPVFAKRTAAGWSSSLGSPRIDTKYEFYDGSDNPATQSPGYVGQVHSEVAGVEEDPSYTYNLYSVKRLHVEMPDGSTHEFRVDDNVNLCGNTSTGCPADQIGVYLSVDGSKMRLEMNQNGTAVLYLPDGSFYGFEPFDYTVDTKGHQARSYTDRNGNRMVYNPTSRQWTDTLGRVITNPLPVNWQTEQEQTVGDVTANFPGLNGGTINATFSWRYLKDPNGGESGLNDTNQTLHNSSSIGCQGNVGRPIPEPHLFTSGTPVRVCHPISFSGTSWTAGPPFNPIVLTKITLANGQYYQFKYNVYGEIEKIVYPSGGYERFAYARIPPVQHSQNSYEQANRGVTDRWVSAKGDGTDEQHWTYAATSGEFYPTQTPYKITTTNPDGTKTEQLIHDEKDANKQRPYGFDDQKTGRPYETRMYSAGNQLLRRTLTAYEVTQVATGENPATSGLVATRDIRPVKEISIIFEPGATSALAAMNETFYDSNGDPAYFASLNPKQSKTYHYVAVDLSAAQSADINTIAALFSGGNLAQTSETDYLYDGSYKARNLVTLPTVTRVKDAAGNIAAQSQIEYDEAAYGLIGAGTDPQWVDPNTGLRGNITTSRSWTDVAANQYIETHAQFDNFGNARKSWDAKGNVSEVEYSSTYKYAYPTKTISTVPDPSGQNGSSTAFETTSVYDLNTGLTVSTTDANGQTSQMEYNDALLRPTKVIPPAGGAQTVMEYADTPNAISVKTKTQIDAGTWAESTVYADGLGRAVKSEKKDDAGNVFTETEYDNMGRVKKVTNPFRNGETKLWTENTYDDLSRITKVVTPDNAEVTTGFDLSTSGTLGTIVTVTDQAGKMRRSLTNALGQLARVDEPNDSGQLGAIASPNQSTAYIYDTLGKMVKVTQGVQSRFFKYDSLGRLLRVRQPEQATNSSLALTDAATGNSDWSAGFTYDANGNLLTATDTKGTTITSAYDNLNRVTTRSYSDLTPQVSYKYDDPNVSYAKGRLTKTSNAVSVSQIVTMDNLGRVLTSRQTTDGVNYDSAYAYNLSGGLLEETYPSGRKVKNTFSTDGDLSKVETLVLGGSYQIRADSLAYTPSGAIETLKLGNNLWETAQFNSRMQVTQMGLGISVSDVSLWKLNYDYGATDNSGNIKQQTTVAPNISPLIQTYTYDSLNRLKSVQELSNGSQTFRQTFVYDRYGNRQFDTDNTTTIPSGCPQAQCNPTVDVNTNRLTVGQGYTYDLAGNIIQDSQGRQFTFNGDNKQIEVKDASNNVTGTYAYDGDGKRIKKITNQETTTFVYSGGKLVAEYTLTSATPQTPVTQYITNDKLGSPRIISNGAGSIISRRDFMPFGEDLNNIGGRNTNTGYQADSVRQKFTGYQRDDETALDFAEARYYNSAHGRFTAVDPLLASGKSNNPQTFNRYIYTGNNPVNFTDSSGLIWGIKDHKVRWFGNKSDLKEAGFDVFRPENWTYQGVGNVTVVLNPKTGSARIIPNGPAGDFKAPPKTDNLSSSSKELIKSLADESQKHEAIMYGAAATGVAAGACVALCVPAAGAAMVAAVSNPQTVGAVTLGAGLLIGEMANPSTTACTTGASSGGGCGGPNGGPNIGGAIGSVNDVLNSATDWERLKKGGVMQGWIQGTDAQTVFNNIAANEGVNLQSGQTGFKNSAGDYIGIHNATVVKNGATRGLTLDMNIGGQRYKIGFRP